jgi:cytochrome c peroxidase
MTPMRSMSARAGLAALLVAALACRSLPFETAAPSRQQVLDETAALHALGRRIFMDPAMSASGRVSCASCHDPAHAFGPPNALPTQPGGRDLRTRGLRAAPSLMYLQDAPPFATHRFDAEETSDDSIDQGPSGGLTWDGRVDRGRDQARLPLLSADEMANATPAQVVAAAARSAYANDMRRIGGRDIFQKPDAAFALMLRALGAYERDPVFYPYSSQYDDFLAGRATLSAEESRGLALFNDPTKGNCARCHPSGRSARGLPPQFTDYGFVAIGVPRNPDLPANRDPAHFDLGLCGPIRTDYLDRSEYCGLFRAPTLRNVATRGSFFHNGVVHSLEEAVTFYATRDSEPERWYPRAPDGTVTPFNDLPPRYQGNVDREAPFGTQPGGHPAFSSDEIEAIVSFLRTLTDRRK